MCKKRIIVMVVAVVLILCAACIPAFADGTYKWSQSADHSSANATYSGRVNWLDEGVAPNYVTYYARISGKDSFLFTDSNAATFLIQSGVMNKTLVSYRIYWNHFISTTQKMTTATSIKVSWSFDGYKGYKSLK